MKTINWLYLIGIMAFASLNIFMSYKYHDYAMLTVVCYSIGLILTYIIAINSDMSWKSDIKK